MVHQNVYYLLFNTAAVRRFGVVRVCTTHKDHFMDFNVVQNLVGIYAVLSICMLQNACSRPKNSDLGN